MGVFGLIVSITQRAGCHELGVPSQIPKRAAAILPRGAPQVLVERVRIGPRRLAEFFQKRSIYEDELKVPLRCRDGRYWPGLEKDGAVWGIFHYGRQVVRNLVARSAVLLVGQEFRPPSDRKRPRPAGGADCVCRIQLVFLRKNARRVALLVNDMVRRGIQRAHLGGTAFDPWRMFKPFRLRKLRLERSKRCCNKSRCDGKEDARISDQRPTVTRPD
mmetsp:Transcript_34846/g.103904  ORF Transcript_34846/g.103904 Transcript_34846/m.103904 type:complete len:217 (+) Transcript_34846:557-1207(+)